VFAVFRVSIFPPQGGFVNHFLFFALQMGENRHKMEQKPNKVEQEKEKRH